MARSPSRTVNFSLDMVNRVQRLFGTIVNAYQVLGLEGLMTYPQFYRGMQAETVTPEQKELAEQAWERWQAVYLRPEVPPSSDLMLTPENRDTFPDWHPEAEEDDEPEYTPVPKKLRKVHLSPRVDN